MCKTKPVLSERGQSWAQHNVRKDEEELGGGEVGIQVRRGKNPRQGESLDKDNDKTDI